MLRRHRMSHDVLAPASSLRSSVHESPSRPDLEVAYCWQTSSYLLGLNKDRTVDEELLSPPLLGVGLIPQHKEHCKPSDTCRVGSRWRGVAPLGEAAAIGSTVPTRPLACMCYASSGPCRPLPVERGIDRRDQLIRTTKEKPSIQTMIKGLDKSTYSLPAVPNSNS
jgi:hypothetical protein